MKIQLLSLFHKPIYLIGLSKASLESALANCGPGPPGDSGCSARSAMVKPRSEWETEKEWTEQRRGKDRGLTEERTEQNEERRRNERKRGTEEDGTAPRAAAVQRNERKRGRRAELGHHVWKSEIGPIWISDIMNYFLCNLIREFRNWKRYIITVLPKWIRIRYIRIQKL